MPKVHEICKSGGSFSQEPHYEERAMCNIVVCAASKLYDIWAVRSQSASVSLATFMWAAYVTVSRAFAFIVPHPCVGALT